ncbi:GGDEF domain-containing protein [Pseudochelatococcus contaminans]|uniref:diguanylate cyclase n=1 Tax=Pseudochelatococcus contaminans TaxID=1538103 RepID=A0A7W6EGT3_9HYPH|nr:GGDEF domain-containing protein [Pseudochelatococcus contaminans]MBB3809615.1 diguanylate cyclase (GGDEF)-like protein [Pseudochelatococcus contaminans]
MLIDPLTLRAVSIPAHFLLGVLLLYSWRRSHRNYGFLFLGIFFSASALFEIIVTYADNIGVFYVRDIGLVLLLAAYGIAWQAARRFEGRSIGIVSAISGAVVWLVFSFFASGDLLIIGRNIAITVLPFVYCNLAAYELYRGRHEYLHSRMALCGLLAAKSLISVTWLIVFSVGAFQDGNLTPALLSEEWSTPLQMLSLLANTAIAFLTLSLLRERLEAEHAAQTQVDPLTGLGNRRALSTFAQRNLRRRAMDDTPLCVALIDLDHFKQINDTYGHLVGDDVLQEFAKRGSSKLRASDALFRIGGEEFLCVVQAAEEHDASRVVERIRGTMKDYGLGKGDVTHAVTMSVGIACSRRVGYALEDLMRASDSAMYSAKNAGRDQVHIYISEGQTSRITP